MVTTGQPPPPVDPQLTGGCLHPSQAWRVSCGQPARAPGGQSHGNDATRNGATPATQHALALSFHATSLALALAFALFFISGDDIAWDCSRGRRHHPRASLSGGCTDRRGRGGRGAQHMSASRLPRLPMMRHVVVCVTAMHSSLCMGQSSFWHSAQQYHTVRQRAHFRSSFLTDDVAAHFLHFGTMSWILPLLIFEKPSSDVHAR